MQGVSCMVCSVVLVQEDDWYVATDCASRVASQGKTIDEALRNLKEALELYYEDEEKPKGRQNVMLTTLEVAV